MARWTAGRTVVMDTDPDSGRPDSRQVVRLLADDARRKVGAVLMLVASATVDGIAERSGLSVRDVVEALTRLERGGLVDAVGDEFRLVEGVFEAAARAEAPEPRESEHADQPADVARVLDVSFRDGRLVQWPAKRSNRLVVLDHLAQQFDIGTRYTEVEVNERLSAFDDDVATMRRYLVDEQFLDRANGEYWRCGGSV